MDTSQFQEDWNNGTRIRRIKVTPEIFNAYVALYQSTQIMTKKMDEVLDHHEHQALIESGLSQGYKMPNVEAVRSRNYIIKIYLDGTDPTRHAVAKDGMIEFPARTARQLHLVARHSTMMISDVLNNINQSDYMLWFRDLKRMGNVYRGPTSLQEVFDVWGSLINTQTQEKRFVAQTGKRLPANWTKLVV